MKLKEFSSLPIPIVAEILGKSQQYVRVGLQKERLPFGTAVQISTQWTYHISYELFKKYIGIEKIREYEKKIELEGK